MYRHYLGTEKDKFQSIIWVVDSADRDRIDESGDELWNTIRTYDEGYHPKSIPVLIFVNKRDSHNGMTGKEVEAKFHLDTRVSNTNNVVWHFQECNAQTGEGLEEGLEFLRKCNTDSQASS